MAAEAKRMQTVVKMIVMANSTCETASRCAAAQLRGAATPASSQPLGDADACRGGG